VYRGFWWGNLRERDHLEDTSIDGRIILRRVWGGGGVDWIHLVQYRALLNAVMNLWVPVNTGNFLTR